jgi:hypothetical protein
VAEGLKTEKAAAATELAFGRFFLRAALAVLFAGVSVLIAWQGLSVKSGAQWLLYLVVFVATDQIANAVIKRIARQPKTQAESR